MKILLLHNRYRVRGGEDVVFDRESALLRKLGLEVDQLIVSSDDINSPLGAAKTALTCAYSEESKKRVAERIRSFRPNIVHAHNTFPILTRSVWEACNEEKVPVVQTLHNYRLFCANALLLREGKPCTLCLDQKPWRAVKYGCYRGSKIASIPMANMIDQQLKTRAWQQVDQFICVTGFAKSLFLKLGIPEEKLAVKMNFSPDVRAELGISADKGGAGAIYFGRLSEEKGLHTLVEAWREKRFPLRVLGNGPLESMAKEAGLSVEGGLSQGDAWRAMARARVVVVPTECYEGGFPLVIQEALALGLPVVATAIGSVSEYLTHGESAFLVPPRDPVRLAEAVERLLKEDDLWGRLSLGGRKLFEKIFTEKTSAETTLGIYERLLRQKPHF